ncbi:MAG: hypothetical protein AAF658_07125 [Myxococcota bacterium]
MAISSVFAVGNKTVDYLGIRERLQQEGHSFPDSRISRYIARSAQADGNPIPSKAEVDDALGRLIRGEAPAPLPPKGGRLVVEHDFPVGLAGGYFGSFLGNFDQMAQQEGVRLVLEQTHRSRLFNKHYRVSVEGKPERIDRFFDRYHDFWHGVKNAGE